MKKLLLVVCLLSAKVGLGNDAQNLVAGTGSNVNAISEDELLEVEADSDLSFKKTPLRWCAANPVQCGAAFVTFAAVVGLGYKAVSLTIGSVETVSPGSLEYDADSSNESVGSDETILEYYTDSSNESVGSDETILEYYTDSSNESVGSLQDDILEPGRDGLFTIVEHPFSENSDPDVDYSTEYTWISERDSINRAFAKERFDDFMSNFTEVQGAKGKAYKLNDGAEANLEFLKEYGVNNPRIGKMNRLFDGNKRVRSIDFTDAGELSISTKSAGKAGNHIFTKS